MITFNNIVSETLFYSTTNNECYNAANKKYFSRLIADPETLFNSPKMSIC